MQQRANALLTPLLASGVSFMSVISHLNCVSVCDFSILFSDSSSREMEYSFQHSARQHDKDKQTLELRTYYKSHIFFVTDLLF